MKNIFVNFRIPKIHVCLVYFIILIINLYSFCLADSVVNIHSVRIWPAPDSIRIVFDLSSPVNYKIYSLTNPIRIAVDFNNAKLNTKLVTDLQKAPKLAAIKQIRTGIQPNAVRVVFELEKSVVINSFILKPNERYGHRLILDLESKEKQEILALFDLDIDKKEKLNTYKSSGIIEPITVLPKKLIIAIDAGHGGEDPGAIGPYGTEEKAVVLELAKALQEVINSTKDKKAFLIRNGDYYVSLRDRRLKARKYKADLFISIHADAVSNSKADGASVFVLSEKGASSAAARWLAESENRSDMLGGVRVDRKNEALASVLLDLSQTANYHASLNVAKSILFSMQKTVPLHKNSVEHAGFAVLKAPDVPSVLVEAGFISNPSTELKLKNKSYQQKIVKSILNGIDQYFLTKQKK
ncbi:MAG: N-acetylmuramoyl-L-alanine amidase [Gammaproteobacteria bacterium]|jgi:N-acetylmuramoyl-L-alanine amidase